MMFTIYETATGRVLRTGFAPENQLHLQVNPDESSVFGHFPSEKFRIEDGIPVEMPLRPSIDHVFNYATKRWEDPRTLEELKSIKWDEIKSQRTAIELGGFLYEGELFDSDLISQQRIQGAAQLAAVSLNSEAPISLDWTLANNSVVSLTANQLIGLGVALGGHINACHTHSRTLRLKIEQAQTKEELDAIVW